ncbi:hypothetical protein [Thermoactinospora rubra]|uniref:hypothetical protein n=1 Tax=Thermoactinospora rubra TaxID=1088767 RepID=UPI00197E8F7C|nr:hypothetical protein [Thermoactinospora rubra]
MKLKSDRTVAVPSAVAQVVSTCWDGPLDELSSQVLAPYFVRREPRLRARAALEGLLSDPERKNGWSPGRDAGAEPPLAVNEIRRLRARLHRPQHPAGHYLVIAVSSTSVIFQSVVKWTVRRVAFSPFIRSASS